MDKFSSKVILKNNIEARYTINNIAVKLALSDIPSVSELERLVRELKMAAKKTVTFYHCPLGGQ